MEIIDGKEAFCSKFFETLIMKVPIVWIFLKFLFWSLCFNEIFFWPVLVLVSFLAYFCELNERRVFND
jgi:hypothetical protein